MLAGVDAVYVGYKNNQLAAPDLNNGIISFMICDVGSAKMILTSGWADALAVTQAEPFAQLPGVPSAPQAGMPDLLFTTWSAFYAPKGTPRDVVMKLNQDIIAAGTSPETAAKLDAMAGGPSFTHRK